MPENKSEVEKLIDDIKAEEPKTVEEALGLKETPKDDSSKEDNTAPEKEDEPYKNRKHRRWEARLTDKERDLLVREARLQALEEVRAERESEKAGAVDGRLLTLFGNDEKGQQAAALFQQLLTEARTSAKEEALTEVQQAQQEAEREVSREQDILTDTLENLEDETGVDFTSNAPAARKARNEILDLMEKYSPKDADGNIIEYADIAGVYETWQMQRQQNKPKNDRQKELASRSMEEGTTAPSPAPKPSPGFFGWRKDFGL